MIMGVLVKLRCTTTRAGMWSALQQRSFAFVDSNASSQLMGQLSREILEAREWVSMPWTAVSFFRFMPPGKMDDMSPETVKALLAHIKTGLADQGAKGTFVLSHEGYNSALVIPTERLQGAYDVLQTADNSLANGMKLFQHVDWNIGDSSEYGDEDTALADSTAVVPVEPFPFKKLVVRTKESVLTDKIPEGVGILDWSDSGPVLSPQQWHDALSQISLSEDASANASADASADVDEDVDASRCAGASSRAAAPTVRAPAPIVLDCRNTYESEEGAFVGSVPLGTRAFSDSWGCLERVLEERQVPKDAPVLTYCTGGIRCMKINAYMRQKLGYTNVQGLQHGIIGYQSWLTKKKGRGLGDLDAEGGAGEGADAGVQEDVERDGEARAAGGEGNGVSSLFEGENFLFDRRRLDKMMKKTPVPPLPGQEREQQEQQQEQNKILGEK